MKRWLRTLAIVLSIIAMAWFALGRPIYNRMMQHSASVNMMSVTGNIVERVRITGAWPRSWEAVFPEGMRDFDNRSARSVIVN